MKSSRPGYSLRAFARDSQLSVSHLSAVLAGKSSLSPQKVSQLCQNLRLSALETSRLEKLAATKQERSEKPPPPLKGLAKHQFYPISHWQIITVWEALKVNHINRSSISEIAKFVNITPAEVTNALNQLISQRLVKLEKGYYIPTVATFSTSTDLPDESIKQFHLQLIQKAASSLRDHSVDQRDMQSLIFAFDKKKMKLIKKEIVSFIEHIDRTYGTAF
jgi:uncharacterized protein (TIGR02147 family)